MIEFKNVTKRYLKDVALKDVTITLPPGKIIGIVGPNGSGKSTTLKLVAGLIRPSSGEILVNRQPVNRQSAQSIAYLSELDAYYSFYTVQQTIDFFATQFSDLNKQKAHQMLDYMKLDPNQKVKHLSKGNRGRLKIILTLARDVSHILLDEPLSGLDPMVRESIIKGLISFLDIEKQTVIITTHEVNEIEPLLDTVMAIRDGEVVDMVDVETLKQDKNIGIVEWMKQIYA